MRIILTEIDCGIGKIEYVEPDNVQLQLLMEQFEESVKKLGPAKLLKLLETVS